MSAGESGEVAARLTRAAHAAAHAIVLSDCDGCVEWANDAFERMTGYSLAEARGGRLSQLLRAQFLDPEIEADTWAALARGDGFRTEVLSWAKDGRSIWVDLDVKPTRGETGVWDGFMAILVDVTRQRELQEKLTAKSVSLRQAGRLARLGAWRVDLRGGLVYWSSELRILFGRSAQESYVDSLNIYAPAERERVFEHLRHAAQTGERVDFEAQGISAAGEAIWLRVMGEAEFAEGKCVAIYGASQDVTEQRVAIAELHESERFGRGVIDGFAGLLTVINEAGDIVAANASFRRKGEELMGGAYDPIGRNMFAIVRGLPRGHGVVLEQGIREVLDGKVESFTRAYTAKDGEWFRCTASRFAGAGAVRAVVVTQSIEDLKRTERRLREVNASLRKARDEANAASLAKSAFLATMSHEIRTPLNGVLGMAQAMARDELPPKQRERLAIVRQAGETLLVLLNDLLDLSRIEAGRLELEDGVVDMSQLLSGVQATFTTLATEKDVHFSAEVAPEACGAWRGDPTRVRQILYNLVSNAVKFTARGSVRVQVSHREGALVIEVTDTGPGIAPSRLGVLFEKFVQEDASTTRRYGGSGLGLAICRELAGLMGGEISAASEVGRGSVFTVRLPLVRAERQPAAVAAPAEEITVAGDLRILAAEDNPMNQLVLKTLLAQTGVEVVCVDDGEQAIAAAAAETWDAILMDVQMPVMDGPTAVRLIRERERAEGRRRTPIIALTANAMAHHEAEYLGAGMDALVPKPLELERLLMTIRDVLEARTQAEARRVLAD
jgi:PAS domain S-box-containing protein